MQATDNNTKPAIPLEEHLKMYGITRFESDDYWEWGAERLGQHNSQRVGKYMNQLADEPDQVDLRAFYDLIARPEIGYVVHSLKADAIRASGCCIAKAIAGRRSVLDLGCNTGYLTTWYGSLSADRQVLGVDWSERSIHEARKFAEKMGVRNVEFQICDLSSEFPTRHFDAIVEAQCVEHMNNRNQALTRIAAALRSGGIFVSVPATTSFDKLLNYAHELPSAGLFVQSISFVGFSDTGKTGAYPVLVCDTTPPGSNVNYEQFYAEMLSFVQTKRQHGESANTWPETKCEKSE